jgi:uncharacterized Ntn-hydrolase superfamily protein
VDANRGSRDDDSDVAALMTRARAILAGDGGVKAMARAFETTKGELAERLLAALDAGPSQGGDARGMQAGGILVVKPIDQTGVTSDRWIDIRVDDSPNPFKALRRLLNISIAGHPSRASGRPAQRYAQAGDAPHAAKALVDAIERHAGWRELASRDPAFDRIRTTPECQHVVR